MVKRVLMAGLSALLSAALYGETVKASHLEQFVLPDGALQISWITENPQPSAKVIVSDASGKKTVVTELTDQVRNHAVVIPSDASSVLVSSSEKPEDALFPAMKIVPVPTVKTKDFRIPLSVSDPAAPRRNFPVRSGVPFAKGVLGSADDAELFDAAGKPVNCSFECFSKWPDGSVKWLIVNFNADTKAGETLKLFLRRRQSRVAKVFTANDSLKPLLSALRCEITFSDGKVAVAQLKEGRITEKTGIPGGMHFTYRLPFAGKSDYILNAVATIARNGLITVDFRIISFRSRKIEELRSIVWKGFPKCSGTDFICRQLFAEPPRHDGFFQTKNFAVYIPDFWQQWPKGATVRDGDFTYEVLPPLPEKGYLPEKLTTADVFCRYFWYREGGLYAFRHNMTLPGSFSILVGKNANIATKKLKAQFEQPLFAAASPEYYCSTGVFGPLYPADGKLFPRAEKCFAESFYNHRKTQEMISDYGWMSWGDWFGERRDNWGNNEYDLSYTTVIQFARTGNPDYLKRAIEMARHYSSIDICCTDNPGRMREVVYAHCIGHVGKLFDPKSVLGRFAKRSQGYLDAHPDPDGGHNFLSGSLFAAALSGDKMMYDAVCRASTQQAIYMSADIRIPIERSPGWFLINQTNTYNFTSNPVNLNAARLIVDAVVAKQNPKTGCLDLPTDQSECNCPDKKQHRCGKAFAMGVLMHGLRFYHEITGEERAATAIIRSANWIMTDCYDPVNKKLRYKSVCPRYFYGSSFETIPTEGVVYAGKLTGERKYAEFVCDHLDPEIRVFRAGTPSKTFAMEWRVIPHTLYYLKEQGITELTKYPVAENPCVKPGAVWKPGFDFASQQGGKVYVRGDKNTLSGGKCFSHWDAIGHSVTWRFDSVKPGRYMLCCGYSCSAPSTRKVLFNGKEIGTMEFPPSGGLGENIEDWKTVLLLGADKKPLSLDLDGKPFELTLVNDCGKPLNFDFLCFQQVK